MALIAIAGDSGMGKTTSIRNLDPSTTFIIQTIPKPLPFKGWRKKYPLLDVKEKTGNRYLIFEVDPEEAEEKPAKEFMKAAKRARTILRYIKKNLPHIKTIIFDDSQYIMSYEYMARAREGGFDRFSSIAQNFHSVISVASGLSEELDIIFLHHTEKVVTEEGVFNKLKTVGKLVDNVVTFEGMFTLVLLAKIVNNKEGREYVFQTNSDGSSTAKSPMGMFEKAEVPNDLKEVLEVIRSYENEE